MAHLARALFPLTEARLQCFTEMAREDRHQEVLEGLLPYLRNPDAAGVLANSLYDWLPTRALALGWLLRTAAGCEPLNSVVIKMGSCYVHGFSTLVIRLLAYDWFLISAKACTVRKRCLRWVT